MPTDESRDDDAPNILIVDDSAMMRTMIKRAIGLLDDPVGTVFEAANGEEAMAVLETQEVQAVFTDINMPVMTGTELLERINEREEWQQIVRVIISTDGSRSRRDEAEDLKVKLYVEKPLRPDVLRDVLTEISPATAPA
jgi:two-component system chemotaxis response regulator CheY